MTKSRTASRERPSSKTESQKSRPESRAIPDLEKALPRPGSRTLAQEEELLKMASDEEKKVARSRTSSRNREDNLAEPVSSEQVESNFPTKRTRTISRDRPKEIYPDFDDEEFLQEQQQPLQTREAKTRTQSR